MGNLKKSKSVAWIGFGMMVLVLILSVSMPDFKQYWWEMIDVFFGFMMVFCHLAALYLEKFSYNAARKLDFIAFICAITAVVAFIVEYIVGRTM